MSIIARVIAISSYLLAFSWGIFILFCLIGWGTLVNRVLFPKYRIDWGQKAAWGVAFSVCVGGLLNLTWTISRTTILAHLCLGFVVWIVDTYQNRHSFVHPLTYLRNYRHQRLFILSVFGVLLLLLIQYAGWVYTHRFSDFDDYPASGSLSLMTFLTSLPDYRRMPFRGGRGNILIESGIGPLTLRDTFILFENIPSSIPLKIFWLLITVVGVIGVVLLLQYLLHYLPQVWVNSQKDNRKEKISLIVFILSLIVIYFFPIGGLKGFFDRYFLLLIPLMMMLISFCSTNNTHQKVNKKVISLVLIMMVLYGGFTIGATHDYLSWNRVRWQALENLMKEAQISPDKIDGGFEFNGWHLYNPKYQKSPQKSWWWVVQDDYIISFGSLPGFEEIKRYSFNKWLPFGVKNIFVLRKNTALLNPSK